jgi:hypothetical protein
MSNQPLGVNRRTIAFDREIIMIHELGHAIDQMRVATEDANKAAFKLMWNEANRVGISEEGREPIIPGEEIFSMWTENVYRAIIGGGDLRLHYYADYGEN